MTKPIETSTQDEKASATSSPWLGSVIEITAEQTGNYLIDKARAQLNKVLFESKKIKDTQSRLKLVMKRYNLQKSTFSTISDFYTERPLWQKLAIASIIIAGAVIAGLFMHTAIAVIFALAAVSLSLLTHIVLEEHSESSSICNEKLCEDLEALENNLTKRMKDLSVIEDKLKGALTSMARNNLHLAEDEQKLREELTQLSQQIDVLCETNKDLTGITKQLQEMNDGLIENLAMIQTNLQSSHQVMQDKTSELQATNAKLLSTDRKLNQGCAELKDINAELAQSIQEFNQLCDEVRQTIQDTSVPDDSADLIANAHRLIAQSRANRLAQGDFSVNNQQSLPATGRIDTAYTDTPALRENQFNL